MENTGVIVVDLQGDFTTLKQGSLAVDQTDRDFLDRVQKNIQAFKSQGFKIFATQDWHPENHISFYTNHPGRQPFDVIEIEGRTQVLWPPHCIQGSENARILLDNSLFEAIVKKGTDPRFDSYSGFQDDGGLKTKLNKILKSHSIQNVVVFGLATDYCVKATALDALAEGYTVAFMENLSRGVAPDTTTAAIEEMKKAGIMVISEFDDRMIPENIITLFHNDH